MDIGNINSTYDNVYNSASSTSAAKMESQLETDFSKATDEELMSVCKEFEAYFMEQVMKSMWKTVPESEESSGANASLQSYYKDEMIKQTAMDSTENNSLGLAQTLYEQMKRNYGI